MNIYRRRFAKWMCKNYDDAIPPLIRICDIPEETWRPCLLHKKSSKNCDCKYASYDVSNGNQYDNIVVMKPLKRDKYTRLAIKYYENNAICVLSRAWLTAGCLPVAHNNYYIKAFESWLQKKSIEDVKRQKKEYEKRSEQALHEYAINNMERKKQTILNNVSTKQLFRALAMAGA